MLFACTHIKNRSWFRHTNFLLFIKGHYTKGQWQGQVARGQADDVRQRQLCPVTARPSTYPLHISPYQHASHALYPCQSLPRVTTAASSLQTPTSRCAMGLCFGGGREARAFGRQTCTSRAGQPLLHHTRARAQAPLLPLFSPPPGRLPPARADVCVALPGPPARRGRCVCVGRQRLPYQPGCARPHQARHAAGAGRDDAGAGAGLHGRAGAAR